MTVISMIPNDTPYLPAKVTEVPKDVLRNFPHSKKVGNYLLGNTLGEGSFAKVKEALHIPTGERVAVKIIDKKKSREDSYVRKNLRREGKILQMIRHKNIVQLLEIMETQNSYYLVTELCRGGDLMDYISQRRRLPETEVKKYIRQIVSAVDYLHRLGILHRDLKIENLLLDEYRDMKIIDFGLSNCIKIMHTKDGPRTQEFCVTQCGSPAYAAPELLGRQKYGPQVDVWSMKQIKVSTNDFKIDIKGISGRGVNMYAMLTGNLPFTVEPFNIKTLHSKMVNGQMNPLPENISKECREVLKKFLTADPDRRITLEDTLKHPWIADGPTTPMPRASCANKLKTEALDNSILKHMSENQGFRIGEIIRYVTGNVPSSATAMYHLMLRKFTKHIGNVKVTGKTQADHRILQRTQNRNALIKVRQDITMDKTNHQLNQFDNKPAVNHTVNNVRNVVTKTTDPEPSLEGEHSNRLKDQNEHNSRVSGHQTWNRRRLKYKYGEDETFTDLLQQKATDVNTPRAYLPVKPRSDYSNNNNQVPNCLPNVAQKYVKRIKTVNTLDTTEARTRTPTSGMEIRRDSRLSGSESQDHDDGQFRQRASTFPGKTQRPKIVINKLSREKQTDQTNCIKGTSDQSKDNPRETVSPTPEPSKVKINNLVTAPGSPRTRRNYLHHSENVSGANSQSNTPRSNQYMFYTRKFHQRRAMNVTHLQASKERDAKHEEESGGYLSKHVLSRPTRNNRIPRVTLGIKGRDEPIVVENFAELSSTGSRALSSRNTNLSGTSTNRSITPGLPSLNPSFTEGGKQNS